ncbi:unnamed protein product [Rodentolepis nana]|uniref:Cytosolic purine 5'-nucleotidase n=1 Tax=Rodentolepis nana TaxID=102285 RepID=A0A158QI28_RODNA|nr:unnamed protein product [Rodentolepis nana]
MTNTTNPNGESGTIGYKRDTKCRIFVNRSLRLDSIRFFGFDMDYTLAQYKSPDYEELAFQICRDRLVAIGYPRELLSFNYEASFPIRGLWFDTRYGTFLKLDQFGNVLVCLRGFNIITAEELTKLYPNKFLKYDESRIVIMNTLFDLPKIYLLSCVIHMFHNDDKYLKTENGIQLDSIYMSYHSIFDDVDSVLDWMHQGEIRPWTSYFDFILTDAKKPLFFDEGTILRAVDENTGRLSIGHHVGPLQTGKIYSGGSCEVFTKLIGARGKDVLYTGDHIFGDILRSKKKVGWRTFLVVPELTNEIYVWKKKKDLFDQLQYLDHKLADAYNYWKVAQEMERSYGLLGSIFRSGSRHTFFSSQALRYADIYSFSCFNLLHYPLCYMFRAPTMYMPHESTVSHEDSHVGSFADLEHVPCSLRRRSYASNGTHSG